MTAAIADAITLRFTKDDSTCFVLPIFHVSWWPILSLLLVGGKVVINRSARPQRDPSAHPGREVHPHELGADDLRLAHGDGAGRLLRPAAACALSPTPAARSPVEVLKRAITDVRADLRPGLRRDRDGRRTDHHFRRRRSPPRGRGQPPAGERGQGGDLLGDQGRRRPRRDARTRCASARSASAASTS